MSTTKIILAGFGGQGILFAGKLLAYAAMKKGKNVSWLPSYGPEMRGGTANCHVVISDEPIASPMVTAADVLIALNGPSLDKFEDSVVKDGTIIYDSSLIMRKLNRNDILDCPCPATQSATDMNARTLANMVAIGAFLKSTDLLTNDEVFGAIDEIIPASKEKLKELNKQAILLGL